MRLCWWWGHSLRREGAPDDPGVGREPLGGISPSPDNLGALHALGNILTVGKHHISKLPFRLCGNIEILDCFEQLMESYYSNNQIRPGLGLGHLKSL